MLLFDMDGTLIDSNGIWKDVDEEFLARRGLPYTQEYYEGVAHTIFPLAARFTKEFCHLPESQEEIMAEWMELAGDIYAGIIDDSPYERGSLNACQSCDYAPICTFDPERKPRRRLLAKTLDDLL